ncbi:hypothetical protein [Gimesia sp.]|uniref:hypothetical protein n=1 Tax=Gimesia sp. TaxID=2024833 RepID=UPI0025B7E1CA|nr:hypothetical protein [Gimesia sp.]
MNNPTCNETTDHKPQIEHQNEPSKNNNISMSAPPSGSHLSACPTVPEKPAPAHKSRVSPNAIRAERSEQEVAATTYNPEPGFPTHSTRPDKPAMPPGNLYF